MKRMGVGTGALVLTIALSVALANAQDKYSMAVGGAT